MPFKAERKTPLSRVRRPQRSSGICFEIIMNLYSVGRSNEMLLFGCSRSVKCVPPALNNNAPWFRGEEKVLAFLPPTVDVLVLHLAGWGDAWGRTCNDTSAGINNWNSVTGSLSHWLM